MTQPQRKPEQPKPPHNPATDPLDQIWVNMSVPRCDVTFQQRETPQPQTSPKRYGPLDKLATRLLELGLDVRRNAFVEERMWEIVAKEPSDPHREVRIHLADGVTSERTENLLVIHVRLGALPRDCEAAFKQAKEFIRGNDSSYDHTT